MRKPIGKIRSEALAKRVRRKLSIRKKITGTADRPRICVNRSNKHIRVQVINDELQKTLFSVQTFGKEAVAKTGNKESAKLVGAKVGELLKAQNLTTAVFDRQGYQYAGVLVTLADSIREAGIKI